MHGGTYLDGEIVDRGTALFGLCLGRRVVGSFEQRDARAEEGDLFFLFFKLTALFLNFFVGDALDSGVTVTATENDEGDLRSLSGRSGIARR